MLTLLERPQPDGLCLIRSIRWSPDGSYLAAVLFQVISGVPTSTVMLWTPSQSITPRVLEKIPGGIRTLTFAGNGQYLVAGVGQNWIRIWELSSHDAVQDLPADNTNGEDRGNIGTAAFYGSLYARVAAPPTGGTLIAYCGNVWYQWDISNPEPENAARPPKCDPVDSMQITADGKTVVFSDRVRVKCFNVDNRFGQPRTLAKDQGCERVIVSRCAERYAYVCGNSLRVGKIKDTRRRRVTLSGHDSFVCAATFGPDGRTVLTGGQDGSTRVWDIDRRQELARYDWGVGRVTSIDLSPDGGTVVTGGDGEQSVVMWDLD